MTLHKCLYCNSSYSTSEKKEKHEMVCHKNGKTDKERFDARQKLKAEKN